jgi:hypothetical protein
MTDERLAARAHLAGEKTQSKIVGLGHSLEVIRSPTAS